MEKLKITMQKMHKIIQAEFLKAYTAKNQVITPLHINLLANIKEIHQASRRIQRSNYGK
jgi:hypothetical protein